MAAQGIPTTPEPGDGYVQSLARGLAVLRAFDSEHPELSLSDVGRRTGLTRATARRLLLTLVELGYVRFDGKLFSLAPAVLELGYAYLSSQRLPELARPRLEDLSARLLESTSLALLDGTDIVYVARVARRRIMTVDIHVGTRFPAYATSMGRVLLAGLTPAELDDYFRTAALSALTVQTIHDESALRELLDQVRRDGYVIVDQELEPGLRSMAAPVVDAAGRTVAAVNVSTNVADPAAGDLIDSLAALRATAAALSTDLRVAGH